MLRSFSKIPTEIFRVYALVCVIFQMYAAVRPMQTIQLRALHLTLFFIVIFLYYPSTKRTKIVNKVSIVDVALIFLVAFAGFYITYFYPRTIIMRAGVPSTLDIIAGIIIIVVTIEATKRVTGLALPIVSMVFLLYSLFANYFPIFSGKGYDLVRVVWQQTLTTEGIFGIVTGVSASYVFLFIFFGVLLKNTGGSDFFTDISKVLVGDVRGGPAKIAVVASSLFGTISGSATANVVGTGSFTIPMMKKRGYTAEFAGSVETVASIGGQIMPPVMGAAAFIMAEILGVNYVEICKAALIPAALYFFSVFLTVDTEAIKMNVKGIDKSELPSVRSTLKKGLIVIFPASILIYLLLFLRWSPGRSVVFSIIALLIFAFTQACIKKEVKNCLVIIYNSIEEAVKIAATTVALVGCCGIIIGTITLTGIGLKVSGALINISGGYLIILLVLVMICAIIFGMGMPTTALYIVVSTLLAPAIIKMGIIPIAAHLFVLYAGLLSGVTPPVAIPAYVAASIANASPYLTAWRSLLTSIPTILVMYNFVYFNELLFKGSILKTIFILFITIFEIFAIICSIQGYSPIGAKKLSPLARIVFIGVVLFIFTGMVLNRIFL